MNITIIGGGNIGTLLAGELAHGGHCVTVYTGRKGQWSSTVEVLDAEGAPLFSGSLHAVTENMGQALEGAELIWIAVPAMAFRETAEKMLPHVKPGQILCVEPGSGGAEFAFRPLIQKGCIFAGLQRVHSIARLEQYGRSVRMMGRKRAVQLAAIPAAQTQAIGAMVGSLLQMPCQCLPNYLCVTLTPSNPILHTTRLCSMFRDYQVGKFYEKNILFYEEWTPEASCLLCACDGELQELCRTIPLPLEQVKSLRVHYESPTPEALTRKIQSIAAFQGLLSPMVQTEEGRWIPDFSSRYFTADFSYGLKVLLEICRIFGVECPHMQWVWDWYTALVPSAEQASFRLALSKEELLRLYA